MSEQKLCGFFWFYFTFETSVLFLFAIEYLSVSKFCKTWFAFIQCCSKKKNATFSVNKPSLIRWLLNFWTEVTQKKEEIQVHTLNSINGTPFCDRKSTSDEQRPCFFWRKATFIHSFVFCHYLFFWQGWSNVLLAMTKNATCKM